jgi:hypothetical protein
MLYLYTCTYVHYLKNDLNHGTRVPIVGTNILVRTKMVHVQYVPFLLVHAYMISQTTIAMIEPQVPCGTMVRVPRYVFNTRVRTRVRTNTTLSQKRLYHGAYART